MQNYELMLAVRGSLIEKDAKEVYAELSAELKRLEAKVGFEEFWGKINLAYKIKHETAAHYWVVNFTMDGSKIKDLEFFMGLNLNIIRTLVTKIEDENYAPITKEAYETGVAKFYNTKEDRQKRSAPKTRATTAKFLEQEMKSNAIQTKGKSSEDKVSDIINKDLSL